MLEATKLELERQIAKLREKKQNLKLDGSQTAAKVAKLERQLTESRQQQAEYQAQIKSFEIAMAEQKAKTAEMTDLMDPSN